MTTTLVRVPLTLAAALAFHVSMSPPTGPIPSTYGPDSTGDRRAIRTTARLVTAMLTKGLYWTSAVTDTLVLLAPLATSEQGLSSLLLLPQPLPLVTIAGTTLAVTGALLRRAAYRALGQFYACPSLSPDSYKPHWGTQNQASSAERAYALVTTGPYALVRHPGYGGLVLCTTGLVVLHLDALRRHSSSSGVLSWGSSASVSVWMRTVALVCAGLSTVGAVWRIRGEERTLKAQFKGEWEVWTMRVRYRLVPGVY